MRCLIFTLSVLLAFGNLKAQTTYWQPSRGHTQMRIWPEAAPDSQSVTDRETTETVTKELVAGEPWISVTNVSQPTVTVYSPSGQNTGAAIVVFPGGGYRLLAIDLEGTEVCEWLASKGITGVLLKYRVPFSGPYWDKQSDRRVYPKALLALEDAQRTLGLVRFHAGEWHIDPHKVGVLGFSAGAHLVAAISTNFDPRLYSPVDEADKESCRPDFVIAIYPGHLWANEDRDRKNRTITTNDEKFDLRPDIHVGRQTPTTFLLQAENDEVDGVNQSLAYYIALKNAGVPVEMHLFAEGGHAFGLRRTKFPITAWPRLVETWLSTIGMIQE